MSDLIKKVAGMDFVKSLQGKWKVYAVGGAVRDVLVSRESKDIDIMVETDNLDAVSELLSEFGAVNKCGKQFAAIKFIPAGWDSEPIDVVIPRADTNTGPGHKDFVVSTGVTIAEDLFRRDFTINSMAVDLSTYRIIDPYFGIDDIKNKIIRCVNPDAFADDPLRMLRGIQFASRFGYEFHVNTWFMIRDNVAKVKDISKERILTEFDKVWNDHGDIDYFIELLVSSGLMREMLGSYGLVGNGIMPCFQNRAGTVAKTRGDFYYLLLSGMPCPSDAYCLVFAGDSKTAEDIAALTESVQWCTTSMKAQVSARCLMFKLYNKSADIFRSGLLCKQQTETVAEFVSGMYPKHMGELAVNGNVVESLGWKGEMCGRVLNWARKEVLNDKVANGRSEIMDHIKKNKKALKEL